MGTPTPVPVSITTESVTVSSVVSLCRSTLAVTPGDWA